MDPLHPSGPVYPNPPAGGGGPGNRPPPGGSFDPADTQPVGPAGTGPAPGAPAPPPPPEADAALQTRAIFRDGQRLLYYTVNFAHFLVPDRVYGHGRIYESLQALTLIRLHAALERLILAQMPLARGNMRPPDQGGTVDWRDLTLFLQNHQVILRSDAMFLNGVAQVRNQLVQGEIVALDREMLIHLEQLGDTIFARLDPGYRRPELDPQKDTLPAPPARSVQAAAPVASPSPAGTSPAPPAIQDDTWLHATPPDERRAAGAQRARAAQGATLYCPNCGRAVQEGDLWCPRCGVDFVGPGLPQPQPEPPGTGHTGRRARGLFGRFMGR